MWSTTSKAFWVSSVVIQRSCLLFADSKKYSVRMTAAFKDEQPSVNPRRDWVIQKISLCLAFRMCSKIFRRTGVNVVP